MSPNGGTGDELERRLGDAIDDLPLIDIHTHVEPGRPHAATLCDLISYHFVLADLEAAGLPREGWQEGDLSPEERVARAIPFFKGCRNTGTFRCLENLLSDLYGIDEPLSPGNWEATYAAVEERGRDPEWANTVLRDRVKAEHVVVDYASRAEPCLLAPDLFSYTREQGGLEWDLRAVKRLAEYMGQMPRSAAEIETGVAEYIAETVPDGVRSVTLSAPIPFRAPEPGRREVDRILLHDGTLENSSDLEKAAVLCHIIHAALRIYEERGIHVALSLGARWKLMGGKRGKTTPTSDPQSVAEIGNLAASYPATRFFVLLCSYPMNQDLSLLAKMQPNVVPTGYWWHAMYPEYVGRMLSERLDAIPYIGFLGFFSDAYMAEWVYGKSTIVRKETARVLAARVRQKHYSEELAMDIARALLCENARRLYLGVGA